MLTQQIAPPLAPTASLPGQDRIRVRELTSTVVAAPIRWSMIEGAIWGSALAIAGVAICLLATPWPPEQILIGTIITGALSTLIIAGLRFPRRVAEAQHLLYEREQDLGLDLNHDNIIGPPDGPRGIIVNSPAARRAALDMPALVDRLIAVAYTEKATDRATILRAVTGLDPATYNTIRAKLIAVPGLARWNGTGRAHNHGWSFIPATVAEAQRLARAHIMWLVNEGVDPD